MDQADNHSVPIKVTLVNENGDLILDTLILPNVTITRSLFCIHGIKQKWLEDAPPLAFVKAHIEKVCRNSIFVGHGIKHDLHVLGLNEVRYIDTYYFEDWGLSDFVKPKS